MVVREPNRDEVLRIARQHIAIGCPIIVARLADVVRDLEDENAILKGQVRRLYGMAYLTIPLPKFLRRRKR